MVLWRKFFRSGVVIVLLLGSAATNAWGQASGGGITSFGGELRGMTQLTGEIVCVECSLEEARAAQPNPRDLYLLQHEDEQVVIRVDSFSDPAQAFWWESIVGLSHRLTTRASERIFEELTAEENLFKEIVLIGLLRSTHTLDISSVWVIG